MKDITLWEEKNSTEPKKKLENKLISVQNGGINETKSESVKKTCEDTGKEKIWKRNCPKCGKDIFHVEKWTRNRFQKDGRLCWSCNKSEDVTNKQFGYLTAIKRHGTAGYKSKSVTWLFKCICGNEVIKPLSNVKKGRGDNCGCKHGEKICKTKGFKEYEWLYGKLQWQCKRKHTKNELSLKEFLEFVKINKCHYCNSIIIWAKHSPECIVGVENNGYHLDRKNNDLGYSKENCVVCCKRCNSAKSNDFSYEEWYGMTEYLRKKNDA